MIYHAPEKFIPYHSKHFFKMANDGSIERWAWILANLLLYSFNYCKKISKFSPKCFKLSLFFKNKNKIYIVYFFRALKIFMILRNFVRISKRYLNDFTVWYLWKDLHFICVLRQP